MVVGATNSMATTPPKPAQEEAGASLLSRLLSKGPSSGSGGSASNLWGGSQTSSTGVGSASGHSALGGSSDFFSYLKGGSNDSLGAPFNSLDSGGPPGLTASGADAVGGDPDEEAADTKRRKKQPKA